MTLKTFFFKIISKWCCLFFWTKMCIRYYLNHAVGVYLSSSNLGGWLWYPGRCWFSCPSLEDETNWYEMSLSCIYYIYILYVHIIYIYTYALSKGCGFYPTFFVPKKDDSGYPELKSISGRSSAQRITPWSRSNKWAAFFAGKKNHQKTNPSKWCGALLDFETHINNWPSKLCIFCFWVCVFSIGKWIAFVENLSFFSVIPFLKEVVKSWWVLAERTCWDIGWLVSSSLCLMWLMTSKFEIASSGTCNPEKQIPQKSCSISIIEEKNETSRLQTFLRNLVK